MFGGFGPDKGLWLGVVLQQVVVDCIFQIVDAGAAAPAYPACGDLGKAALDEVQPRRAGGREMQLEPRMFFQPGLHFERLVGGVGVKHQMQVARLANGAVDAARNAGNSLARWRGMHSPMTMPDFTSRAANSVVVPWRL